jgi:hypothetical protein
MSTYKNETGGPIEVTLYELRVPEGHTFEIPDEDRSFDGRPGITRSRVRNPDEVPDPAVVAAVTGPIPTVPAATPDHFSA